MLSCAFRRPKINRVPFRKFSSPKRPSLFIKSPKIFKVSARAPSYSIRRFSEDRLTTTEMEQKKYPKLLASSETAFDLLQKSTEVKSQGETKIIITGYNNTGFQINEKYLYSGPIVAFPHHVFYWNIPKFDLLTVDHFRILDLIIPETQTILLGTGSKTHFVSRDIVNYFLERGMTLESMRIGPACNTFNTLNHDSRSVALFACPSDFFEN